MDTFNFPLHKQSTKEPNNGFQVQFGTGYTFSAAPNAPDQRVFTLFFTGFRYYVNSDGTINSTTNAARDNVHALYLFYKAHRLNVTFIYPHPIFGNVNVRFKDPLELPKGVPDGKGVIEDFQITMVEQP